MLKLFLLVIETIIAILRLKVKRKGGKEMGSFADVRITIGDKRFLIKQVPFRGNDANTLPANKLTEIVMQRLAGSDSITSFRNGDDAKKAWGYLSQRTYRGLEKVEVPSDESIIFFDANSIGKILLNTEFQGKDREFVMGLVNGNAMIDLMHKIGIDKSKYSISEDSGVINGLSLNDMHRLIAAINARSLQSFSLPSHDFIKHVEVPIGRYLKLIGIERVWLQEEHMTPGNGVVFDFSQHTAFAFPENQPDPGIGIILQVTE